MADYKSLEHGSTVIVVKTRPELCYVLEWCELNGKHTSKFMYSVDSFPICLSVDGDMVGWTDRMDRALYYKPFLEFIGDIT